MNVRNSIFFRINGIIIFLLMPILILYAYSNEQSVNVIRELLQKDNFNQMLLLRKQMDEMTDVLSMNSVMLTRDSSVVEMELSHALRDYYRITKIESTVAEKIKLQSLANHWSNDISVYFPDLNKTISTGVPAPVFYPQEQILNKSWSYVPATALEPSYLKYYETDPYLEKESLDRSNVVVEVRLYMSNLVELLDQFKMSSKGDPFLINSADSAVWNQSMDKERAAEVLRQLKAQQLEDSGSLTMRVLGDSYIVNYMYVKAIDFYIVDFLPTHKFLLPVTVSRNLFYIGLAVMLVTGLLASFTLYKQVRVPLHALIHVLRKFKNGEYSARIVRSFHNEFDFLSTRYNEMAEQVQYLIENVYEEQSRSRLSMLKQLQAQINPHFLYNCLFFIASSAELKQHESAAAMAYNLSDYYRYMTRLENQTPTLADELKLVENYLEIHKLRLRRIEYRIDVSDELREMRLPRLVLQPIVENAIVHGLEPKPGGGTVRIEAVRTDAEFELRVEDDGVGMSAEELQALNEQLAFEPSGEDSGYGLWNVKERLKYWYGESASMSMSMSTAGSDGVCVTLKWNLNDQEEKRDSRWG